MKSRKSKKQSDKSGSVYAQKTPAKTKQSNNPRAISTPSKEVEFARLKKSKAKKAKSEENEGKIKKEAPVSSKEAKNKKTEEKEIAKEVEDIQEQEKIEEKGKNAEVQEEVEDIAKSRQIAVEGDESIEAQEVCVKFASTSVENPANKQEGEICIQEVKTEAPTQKEAEKAMELLLGEEGKLLNKEEKNANPSEELMPSGSVEGIESASEQQSAVEELEELPEEALNLPEKKVVEAALFMVPDGIKIPLLARKIRMKEKKLAKILKELKAEYEEGENCFAILDTEDGLILTLKPLYMRRVGALAGELEISKGAQKLLALLSKNENMLQSKLVRMLGSGVYEYKQELIDKGYIDLKKSGRSFEIKVTKKFKDRFG